MAFLYKIVIVGQAWLTAAMTLFAGMPHFSCACPDGNVKPVCVTTTSSGCCCAGTCCAKAQQPAERQQARSCCSNGSNAVQRIAIGRTCCSRTFAQSQAPTFIRASVERVDAAGMWLPSSTFDPYAWLQSADGSKPWQAHAVSPPTDFLALFRHYVI